MAGRIVTNTETVKLDMKDRKIISLLTQNSRLAFGSIAAKVMLSRDAVRYRIARLQEKGVLSSFVPVLDFSLLGFNTYHLFLQIEEMGEEAEKKLFSDMMANPRVMSVMEYSDNYDIGLTILARNAQELDAIVTSIMNQYPEQIDDYVILELIKSYGGTFIPRDFIKQEEKKKTPKSGKLKMDEKDRKILLGLSRNCRQSFYDLGNEVKLSPDAVTYRINKMQQAGIIREYSAIVNLSAIGYNWYTLFVWLKYFDEKHETRLNYLASTHPNILYAGRTIGEWNLVIYIAAATQKQFHQIVKEIRGQLRPVIKTYETLLGYQEHIYKAFPEGLLTE